MNYDVVVIGGGPAGIAAATKAAKDGGRVALIERADKLGGILNQCIHNGFGLHYFGRELTGVEYAYEIVKLMNKVSVDIYTQTIVLQITKDKTIFAVNPKSGIMQFSAKAIVLAMGCRERSGGAIALCGSRPEGVYTAGFAQKMCNNHGYLVGKKIVILGSGDIGLIMARRMTFEGAKVLAVVEMMPYSSGLRRNIAQCVEDFDIPLLYSYTVTRVVGKDSLSGVYIAPVDENSAPILSKEKFIECDCLLLSVGLIPENELSKDIDIPLSPLTNGAICDDLRQTDVAGIFACGNVLHVHDLVDNVSKEGELAGSMALKYAKKELNCKIISQVFPKGNIRYVLPNKITNIGDKVDLFFRVKCLLKNVSVVASANNNVVAKKKFAVLAPGEMECITIDKTLLSDIVTLEVE